MSRASCGIRTLRILSQSRWAMARMEPKLRLTFWHSNTRSPLNQRFAVGCGPVGQVVVSFRGLPGGSARRRRPTSFSNLLIVRSPASGLPVCVARRRAVMSLGSSACRRKTLHASGDGLNPAALIKSLGKLSKVAWPTCTAALDQVYFQAKVAMDARTGFRST